MEKKSFFKSKTLNSSKSKLNQITIPKAFLKFNRNLIVKVKPINQSQILYIKNFCYSKAKQQKPELILKVKKSIKIINQQLRLGISTSLYEKYQKRHSHLLNEVITKLKQATKQESESTVLISNIGPENMKKNGLTLLPQTTGANALLSLNTKNKEKVIRSAVSLRRMEYNEKIQNKPPEKDSNKVLIIQRIWRQYYLSGLIKRVIFIQRRLRKALAIKKRNGLIVQYQRLISLIKAKCYRLNYKIFMFKLMKRKHCEYAICNREINVYLKADKEKNKAEESLKLLFNIDINSNNVNNKGAQTFPRLKNRINLKSLIRRNKHLELSIHKEVDINIRNSFYDYDNKSIISFISNYDDYNPQIRNIILKKVAFFKWEMILMKRSLFSLMKIKLIQRTYRKYRKSNLNCKLKKRSLVEFGIIVFSIMKKKAASNYRGALIEILSKNQINHQCVSNIANTNIKEVVAIPPKRVINKLKDNTTPSSVATAISFNPIKSKEVLDDFSFDESIFNDH